MPATKSLLTPLYQRGGLSKSNVKYPPFLKEDKETVRQPLTSSPLTGEGKELRPAAQQTGSASAQRKRDRLNCSLVLPALMLILLCAGCASKQLVFPEPLQPAEPRKISRLGYAIQVGAFANLDNAVRLNEALERQGLEAYYFVHETGLYKVRFGDFPTKEAARRKAEAVLAAGIIDGYYLVSPADYAVQRQRRYGGGAYLRDEIVETAKRFIGVPYRWGGTSLHEGFDCSGLTMVVYELNGLKLPRSSRAQYSAGTPIQRSKLSRGDLVFFATSGGGRVSHVGIYVGKGRFIHAPSRGKRIRTERLAKRYFKSRYVGARTYLR